MKNLDTYSPTVLTLRSAHHLQTIWTLGDLKLGYLSVRKRRCLDWLPFHMHFRCDLTLA